MGEGEIGSTTHRRVGTYFPCGGMRIEQTLEVPLSRRCLARSRACFADVDQIAATTFFRRRGEEP